MTIDLNYDEDKLFIASHWQLIIKRFKKHKFDNLRDFFKYIYQVLLGQEQGPRLGSFIKLYGIDETINSLKKIITK